MEGGARLQGGPQGAMQTVLQVQLVLVRDDMREDVAVERRILAEKLVQCEHRGDRDELVQAQLALALALECLAARADRGGAWRV